MSSLLKMLSGLSYSIINECIPPTNTPVELRGDVSRLSPKVRSIFCPSLQELINILGTILLPQ